MEIKSIKSEQDYQKALARLEIIFDADPNTTEGDDSDLLSMIIDNYENQYYRIDIVLERPSVGAGFTPAQRVSNK